MTPAIRPDVADAEWHDDVPRSVRGFVTFGLALMLIAFGGFGAWAFRAPLAAAVIVQGSFVATGENKIVQHLEGGVIEEILVAEGDRVEEGALLVRLDDTAASANERSLDLRQIRLEAMEARLRAEYDGASRLVLPAAIEARQDEGEIAGIIDGQRTAFAVTRGALRDDLALLDRNVEALEIRRAGYAAQLDAYRRQAASLEEDAQDKAVLLEKGLVRRTEVSALLRARIDAEGEIGRLSAETGEIAKMIERYKAERRKALGEYRRAAQEQLQSVQAELDGIREQARAARGVKARTGVTAPVAGTVVRLYYHTPGGVIESGRPIVEILPAGEDLIVEVLVSRNDIDSVREGQGATVRLTALNQRTTPVLEGTVAYVSADAVPTSGAPGVPPQDVYVARIALTPEELSRVKGFKPTPGMPAQAMILSADRTFVQYLVKPVRDSMSRAFREQ